MLIVLNNKAIEDFETILWSAKETEIKFSSSFNIPKQKIRSDVFLK